MKEMLKEAIGDFLPVREPLIAAENLEYCEEDGNCLFTEVSFRL
jgi:hypothetical protein